MANDDYLGPLVADRCGRGMGAWVGSLPGSHSKIRTIRQLKISQNSTNSAIQPHTRADPMPPYSSKRRRRSRPSLSPRRQFLGDPPDDGVRISVIGPLEVESWLEPPTRHKVTEALCFLAFHRKRPVTTEELQIALSGDGDDSPETSAKSVRTYMSELRRCLGAEHVPSARGSGYRLAQSVTTDWDVFQARVSLRPTDVDDQLQALIDG